MDESEVIIISVLEIDVECDSRNESDAVACDESYWEKHDHAVQVQVCGILLDITPLDCFVLVLNNKSELASVFDHICTPEKAPRMVQY